MRLEILHCFARLLGLGTYEAPFVTTSTSIPRSLFTTQPVAHFDRNPTAANKPQEALTSRSASTPHRHHVATSINSFSHHRRLHTHRRRGRYMYLPRRPLRSEPKYRICGAPGLDCRLLARAGMGVLVPQPWPAVAESSKWNGQRGW